MPEDRVVENVLGTIGTVCWTCQVLPQNWKSWREHSTDGLSAYLMFLWAVAAVFLGIYNVSQDISIPLIIQPQLFGFLSALSWVQKRSLRFCLLVLALFCLVGGGLEAGMTVISKQALNKGNERPVQCFGIAASVIIVTGLLPQYWEIWKRKKVIGVSYYFITVDTLGGVFSLLSLVFKPEFDIIAAIPYSLVVAMDIPILIAALIFNHFLQPTHPGSVLDEETEVEANQHHAQNQETRHSVKPPFWTWRKSPGEKDST
ncbi:hypothetical protein BU17DRAFT_90485 [Hysterangium stoloniferum]|nr:hypothetical protein BU17DRAFT_90485 [Hysterangium stoloniferum]